jgi:hypothetical protein
MNLLKTLADSTGFFQLQTLINLQLSNVVNSYISVTIC